MCRPHSGHHGSRTVRRHQIRDRQFSPKGSRKQCPALGDQLARGARADEGAGELGRGIPRSEWFLSYSLQLQPAMPGSAAGECQDVTMLRPWGTHCKSSPLVSVMPRAICLPTATRKWGYGAPGRARVRLNPRKQGIKGERKEGQRRERRGHKHPPTPPPHIAEVPGQEAPQ